jgi:cyclopropane-fatty-acyl-phospholipid synthase
MNTPNPKTNGRSAPPLWNWKHRWARKLVLKQFESLAHGQLTLIDHEATHQLGDASADSGARVKIHNPAFYPRMVKRGSMGAAESYMEGHWSCDDLTALFQIFIRNLQDRPPKRRGDSRLANLADWLIHRLHPNTKAGSRKNIHAHYDLGNDFFSLFLDETMTYSAGIFQSAQSSLTEASRAKIDRICRKLHLKPGDQLLEIGTGWGALAIHAAREYGCRVTTTTISQEQHHFARQRVVEAGLEDRITLLMKDYRDLEGQYDKLVSIEMIEAVGHQFFETYFQKCSSLLKPEGLMGLQAITMNDQRFAAYLRSVDFIQRYIFPGGCLPSVTRIMESIAQATDLRILHLEDIAPHYAQTLRCWRDRFFEQLNAVREQGYPESFIRMWEYYLCYCEAAFEERYIGTVQIVFAKPKSRHDLAVIDLANGRPSCQTELAPV